MQEHENKVQQKVDDLTDKQQKLQDLKKQLISEVKTQESLTYFNPQQLDQMDDKTITGQILKQGSIATQNVIQANNKQIVVIDKAIQVLKDSIKNTEQIEEAENKAGMQQAVPSTAVHAQKLQDVEQKSDNLIKQLENIEAQSSKQQFVILNAVQQFPEPIQEKVKLKKQQNLIFKRNNDNNVNILLNEPTVKKKIHKQYEQSNLTNRVIGKLMMNNDFL